MNVLKFRTKTDASGRAEFSIPTDSRESEIEVVIVVNSLEGEKLKKPELSQFFGKMIWKGDAFAEQTKLRNEWA